MVGNGARFGQRLKPNYQSQMNAVVSEYKIIKSCKSVGFTYIIRTGSTAFCVEGVTTALDCSLLFEGENLCVGLCGEEQVILHWASFIL